MVGGKKKYLLAWCLLSFCHADLIFDVANTDLSYQFLKYIFGTFGLNEGEPNIVTRLMEFFLQFAAILATITALVITVSSAFTAASEGEIFGKNISSLASPIKIITGVGLLVPGPTGYSVIQTMFIWCVLNGIGLANQVWYVVVDNYKLGNTITADRKAIDPDVESITKSLFKIALAVAKVNADVPNSGEMYMDYITSAPDRGLFKEGYHLYYQPNEEFPQIAPAIARLPIIYSPTDNSYSDLFKDYIIQMSNEPFIIYGAKNNFQYNDDIYDSAFAYALFSSYAKNIQDGLMLSSNNMPKDDLATQMKNTGWMNAGLYYWDLYLGKSDTDYLNSLLKDFKEQCTNSCLVDSAADEGPDTFLSDVPGTGGLTQLFGDEQLPPRYRSRSGIYINSLYDHYKNYQFVSPIDEEAKFSQTVSRKGDGFSFLLEVFDDINSTNFDLTLDRLHLFIEHNVTILKYMYSLIFGSLGAMVLLPAIYGVFKGYSPLFHVLMDIMIMIFMIMMPIITTVIGTAIMGSMYVSFIPGFIFAAGMVAWIVKVIEGLVAAPIIAVAFMHPSEDELGKAQKSLMSVIIATLKPSLMIIGFAFSTKICQISLMFLGASFYFLGIQIQDLTGPIGLFFNIMLYEMTTILSITFITRAFGIINSLPEQVFMVIGQQPQEQDAEQLIRSFEEGAQEGSKSFGEIIGLTGSMAKIMSGVVAELGAKDGKSGKSP